MPTRFAELDRQTKETQIYVSICLDGTGTPNISTGIGFFDHMLTAFSKHGLFDLTVQAKGDLEIDPHHTVEDVGIVIGKAINGALGNKAGILRFGWAVVPMDEALVLCSIDISGRGMLCYAVDIEQEKIGALDTILISEFFEAIARNAGITLHIRKLSGADPHHTAEAVFKSFAKALEMAVSTSERIHGVPSTKGTL